MSIAALSDVTTSTLPREYRRRARMARPVTRDGYPRSVRRKPPEFSAHGPLKWDTRCRGNASERPRMGLVVDGHRRAVVAVSGADALCYSRNGCIPAIRSEEECSWHDFAGRPCTCVPRNAPLPNVRRGDARSYTSRDPYLGWRSWLHLIGDKVGAGRGCPASGVLERAVSAGLGLFRLRRPVRRVDPMQLEFPLASEHRCRAGGS